MTALRGVGAAVRERLARLGVRTVGDLLTHAPRGYQDRRRPLPLAQVASGSDACVSAAVVRVGAFRFRGRRTPAITIADDAGDAATLYAFGRPQMGRALQPGQRVLVYGRFDRRRGRLSAGSFELLDPQDAAAALAPVYPATAGLTQPALRRLIGAALAAVAPPDPFRVPADVAAARRLPDKAQALACVHRPASPEAAEAARRALAYEELFLLQLTLARRSPAGRPRPARRPAGRLQAAMLERLPFALTGAQRAALAEIDADLRGPRTSARLLQGDVGCGKTLVALLAAAGVVDAGQQAAVMVPSEALCFQHAETASRLLEPLGVRLGLLSGSTDRASRALLLAALAAGGVDVLVSTHAVLSEPVRFADLGLVVIDEQHKFGVAQRAAVAAKAPAGDLILMTATPIPRTLALTFYGDLTVTSIGEQPPGRPPVRTHLVRHDHRERVYRHVESELAAGRQAYFVCPSIGEDSAGDGAEPGETGDLFAAAAAPDRPPEAPAAESAAPGAASPGMAADEASAHGATPPGTPADGTAAGSASAISATPPGRAADGASGASAPGAGPSGAGAPGTAAHGAGAQPAAEDSPASARALYARLRERFAGYRIGLVHGAMAAAEQRAALSAFHAGAVSALVATTVVEVGLDVPNATCMVVEHAERFGLAALHQLRGRVGRGAAHAYAFFIFGDDLTPHAAERLRALKEHADGFALADLDLTLRGPGELAGARQAGMPALRFARLAADVDLMRAAQADARRHHRAGAGQPADGRSA